MDAGAINLNLVRGVLMVLLIIAFLGTWAWAWSSKRKDTFDHASMLPLEEDDGQVPPRPDTQQEPGEKSC